MALAKYAVKSKILNRSGHGPVAEKRWNKDTAEPLCVLDIEEGEYYTACKDKLYREGGHKPRLRGTLHEIQFVCWPLYAHLLLRELTLQRTKITGWLFLLSYLICFGASSQYHRRNWPTNDWERFMQRLDYCGIFFIITGSYTVPALCLLGDESGLAVMLLIWSGCLMGCFRVLVQKRMSNVVSFVLIGCSLFPFISELLEHLSSFECWCVFISWALLGAAVYVFTSHRGDFLPNTFGFHETFHVLITAASIATYLAAFSIMRRYECNNTGNQDDGYLSLSSRTSSKSFLRGHDALSEQEHVATIAAENDAIMGQIAHEVSTALCRSAFLSWVAPSSFSAGNS
mmetsp:Transcript_13960/g.21211  ORF Transcript_13960/g.21211 Transcript_13960/m.21211 type:complete len:343 (+) Transcript_13960:91-1119(+)